MPDGYFLSERDKELLAQCKKLIAEAEARWWHDKEDQVPEAPEVHLAAMPVGKGIRAYNPVNKTAGVGRADLYRAASEFKVQRVPLTTRSSAFSGQVTAQSGHGLFVDDYISIAWPENGSWTNHFVSQVQGTLITFVDGGNEPSTSWILPPQGTTVTLQMYSQFMEKIEKASQLIINHEETPVAAGTDPPGIFPIIKDKNGQWYPLIGGSSTVNSFPLQPTTDLPGSQNLSGNWLNASGTFWKLKQNTEGSDTLEYVRDESDEKVAVQARNLTTYDIKGSTADIETGANLVPQICYGIEDEKGQVWIIKSYPDSKAKWIRFSLPSGGLLDTELDKTLCNVLEFWDGYSPGDTVTVRNLAISVNHQFYGAEGAVGIATFDPTTGVDVYRAVHLECPPPAP